MTEMRCSKLCFPFLRIFMNHAMAALTLLDHGGILWKRKIWGENINKAGSMGKILNKTWAVIKVEMQSCELYNT